MNLIPLCHDCLADIITFRPEGVGAICAIVYLLVIIVFIPFPFYKDIVAATSGGGKRDVVLQVEHVHAGRHLARFPHSKVCTQISRLGGYMSDYVPAGFLPRVHPDATIGDSSGYH